jgi:NhaA family Na+:H+ antiporter
MDIPRRKLTHMFTDFFDSEKSGGIVLIICTAVSLLIANTALGTEYQDLWRTSIGGLSIEHWINDALMAVFFLLIGLELERELYSGELSDLRQALLPIFAAVGGTVAPALIHLSLNAGTPTQSGIGIPMATDIAFALGVLALLGTRVPASLKVFVVAFAVMDDLLAIIVIAVFYTADLSVWYLAGAVGVWGLLFALNRVFRIMSLIPYILGGTLMWFFMLQSGVHATLAGVMLAFAIPFSARDEDRDSPSFRLEHSLHKPVAFIILPIFALANTAVILGPGWMQNLTSANSLGIAAGLVLGKPFGVTLFAFLAVTFGLSRLPADLRWRQVFGAGLLGGIGFTMSIFITILAFPDDTGTVSASKIAILFASLAAGTIGFLWLSLAGTSAVEKS